MPAAYVQLMLVHPLQGEGREDRHRCSETLVCPWRVIKSCYKVSLFDSAWRIHLLRPLAGKQETSEGKEGIADKVTDRMCLPIVQSIARDRIISYHVTAALIKLHDRRSHPGIALIDVIKPVARARAFSSLRSPPRSGVNDANCTINCPLSIRPSCEWPWATSFEGRLYARERILARAPVTDKAGSSSLLWN